MAMGFYTSNNNELPVRALSKQVAGAVSWLRTCLHVSVLVLVL